MLVLISSEMPVQGETSMVNEMFQMGLDRFHLRRPTSSENEDLAFLESVDSQHLSKVSIHQHHDLANDLHSIGIHFKEADRIKSKGLNKQVKISTSFHSISDLKRESKDFDYCFLSPVFDSISKSDYRGKEFNVQDVSGTVVALGGITRQNLKNVFQLGFSGAAVLGAIWNSNDPLNEFVSLVNEYNSLA